MSLSLICHVVATAFWFVSAALVLSDEAAFLGMNSLEWGLFGLPFHGLGHWIPGHTDHLGAHR